VDGACQPPPPPGCTGSDDCDDGNPCTENLCDNGTGTCSNPPIAGCVPCDTVADCDDGDVCTENSCVAGRCVSDPVPGCGDGCVCTGQAAGEPCVNDNDCCVGYCDNGFCTGDYGEMACAPLGNFCANDAGGANACCSGICEGCVCACLGDDQTCAVDRQCCGGFCASETCCREVDARCTSDAQCCGGHCADWGDEDDETGERIFTCGQGSTGTPCRFDGDCINGCTDDGVCDCSAGNWCWDDNDCCAGTACVTDSSASPFAGVCG
jgi:hypothetical protein